MSYYRSDFGTYHDVSMCPPIVLAQQSLIERHWAGQWPWCAHMQTVLTNSGSSQHMTPVYILEELIMIEYFHIWAQSALLQWLQRLMASWPLGSRRGNGIRGRWSGCLHAWDIIHSEHYYKEEIDKMSCNLSPFSHAVCDCLTGG